jgi:hypothetical protein
MTSLAHHGHDPLPRIIIIIIIIIIMTIINILADRRARLSNLDPEPCLRVCLVMVQDAGLHTHMRTLDIRFSKPPAGPPTPPAPINFDTHAHTNGTTTE